MSLLLTSEGIVLRKCPYRDCDRILSVFSKDAGLLKFITRHVSRPKNRKNVLLEPLFQAEFTYTTSQGDIYHCRESSVVAYHFELRNNITCLKTACNLLDHIHNSQQPGKNAPLLYQLLLCYLKYLPKAAELLTLETSFLLKILVHDGLFDPSMLPSYHMTTKETALFCHLAYSKQFDQLQQYPIDTYLYSKVLALFHALI